MGPSSRGGSEPELDYPIGTSWYFWLVEGELSHLQGTSDSRPRPPRGAQPGADAEVRRGRAPWRGIGGLPFVLLG